jgi:hypothetical protein
MTASCHDDEAQHEEPHRDGFWRLMHAPTVPTRPTVHTVHTVPTLQYHRLVLVTRQTLARHSHSPSVATLQRHATTSVSACRRPGLFPAITCRLPKPPLQLITHNGFTTLSTVPMDGTILVSLPRHHRSIPPSPPCCLAASPVRWPTTPNPLPEATLAPAACIYLLSSSAALK